MHVVLARASAALSATAECLIAVPDTGPAEPQNGTAGEPCQAPASAVPGTGPAQTQDETLEELRRALTAGRRLRLLLCERLLLDPVTATAVRQLAAAGADVRALPGIPVPALITSDQVTVWPGNRPDRAAVITDPDTIAVLASIFEGIWDIARPVSIAQACPAGGQLLTLLTAGLTDDAAARHLGVSVRTVRRQVAVLMRSLGAASRFQAGHEATRRGWLG